MLDTVFGGLVSFAKLRGSYNDDWVDRLNHVWTVILLGIFTLFVTTAQLSGSAIECWTPAEFKDAWVEYTKSYCWVANTYFIYMDDRIPESISERVDAEIQYYQWVPVILLMMAFMFKLPNMVWHIFDDFSGINLEKVRNLAEQTQYGDPEERTKAIKHIAMYMDRWLCHHREVHGGFAKRVHHWTSRIFFFACSRTQGTYLTGMYLLVKILYVANTIGQFFLLNAFLAMEFSFYGPEVVQWLSHTGTLRESVRFPRVTLCDLQIRQMTNVLRYSVQCVLPINLFNEKVFAILWFWMVVVAIITCSSFVYWLYRVFFSFKKTSFVKKYLQLAGQSYKTDSNRKFLQPFAMDYLRDDGVFVLRVVGKNSTELVVTDLITELWLEFKKKPPNGIIYTDTLDEDAECV